MTLLLCAAGSSAVKAQTIEDIKESSIGFKTPTLSRFKETNIDPFTYRGEPINYGSFLLWPNLTLEQIYNDNVLAVSNNEQGDFATIIKPELIVKKEFGRHEFIGALNADIHQFYDETSENVENYSLKLEADLEAKQGINIPVRFSYRDGHISRRDQTRASAADVPTEPLGNQNLEIESGIIIKPNRFSLSLLGNYRQGRLDNGRLNNGTVLIRENRDVNKTSGTLRLGYDYSETLTPYLEYQYTDEDYINETPGAVSRNNAYNRVQIGSFFDYRGLVTGAIGIGHDNRSYDSAGISDTSGLSFDGKIFANPTEKTQVGFQFSRDRIEDNVIIAGLTRNYAKLNLTHEIMHNFFFKGGLGYEVKDFENINREDKTYDLNLGLNYIFSPRLQVGTEYEFITRDSTLNTIEMDNSTLFIRARFSL